GGVAGSTLASGLGFGVARGPRLSLLWAIGVAGCAAAASRGALGWGRGVSPEPVARAITVDWIVLSYVLAGLIAWWRRPESRFGPLMAAAGFAAFLSRHEAKSGLADLADWCAPWALPSPLAGRERSGRGSSRSHP